MKQRLRERVATLINDPLGPLLADQLRILKRLEEDTNDLFALDDPMRGYNDELTRWEGRHLAACLEEWLDVVEQNRARATGSAQTINVRDYGAIGDGKSDDAGAVRLAVAALSQLRAGATLVFPTGRYRLTASPGAKAHLLLCDLCDVTLRGEGDVVLLGTECLPILRLETCRNVRFKNIAIDYHPPLYSQGKVVSIAADRRWLSWELAPGYRQPTDRLYNPEGTAARCIRPDSRFHSQGMSVRTAASEHPTMWQVTRSDGNAFCDDISAGWSLLLYNRVAECHAFEISNCRWVDCDHIQVWGAGEFAVFVESNTGVSFRGCYIGPRPGGRLAGINADGIHARSNRYGPFIESCRITRVQDDCMNLYSRMSSVEAVLDDRTIIIDCQWDSADRRAKCFPGRFDFLPGDLLAVVDPMAGAWVGHAVISAVEPRDWHGHQHLAVTLDRPIHSLRSRDSLGRHQPVEWHEYLNVDKPIPIEHFVVNASTKSDGFVIRDCDMGQNTVTAGKIKAGNGLIINNRTSDHGWCVWSFATEVLWQEGYAARRVLVSANQHSNWFGIFMGSQYPWGRCHMGVPWNYCVEISDNHIVGHASHEYAIDINGIVGCAVTENVLGPDRPITVGPTARGVRITANRAVESSSD